MKLQKYPITDNISQIQGVITTQKLLSLAIVCALNGAIALSTVTPFTVYAQEIDNASSSRYTVSIPAGKLSDVLAQFAARTGVPLSFNPSMLAGIESNGLQGSYRIKEGFALILAGTDYQLIEKGEGGYSISYVESNITTLAISEVSSSTGSNSTEDTESYTIYQTNTATKLTLTPRETPQIVNSITNQLIDDFAAQNMEDIMTLAPGVSIGHTDDDRRSYTSRGYAMAVQYDGLPSGSGIDGGVASGPDSAFIDRVDVLLGASGLMNGAGQPGGVINMVYKRPTDEFKASASVTGGSWGLKRMTADVSGSLNKSGTVRGRMVAVDQDEESFRDFEKEKKKGFYTIVEADITDDTLVYASIQNQDIYDNVTDRGGLPTDNDGNSIEWDRSTFLAPSWNRWNKYSTIYKVGVEQYLGNDWQLKMQASQQTSEADWLFATIKDFDSDSGDGNFSRWGQYNKETSDSVELFLSGPVLLFNRTHEVVVGGNWKERNWGGRDGDGTDYTTNLYDFDPEQSIPTPELTLDNKISDQITEEYGSYVAGHFDISDNINAIVGTRLSWYYYEYKTTVRDENAVLSPYLGLTYDLNSWATAYASYSDIFNPQSAKDTSGNALEPEVGSNIELGLKGEFYDGNLNTSLAIFNITKDNEAELMSDIPFDANNICGGWCYAAKGETTTTGIDLGMSGQITEEIQVMAGFTSYEKNDNNKRVNILKLSTSYSPTGQDWTIGGNVDSSTKSYGQWGMSQDARTLVGLFGKYQINEQVSLALNLNNLLDDKYYANSIDSGYGRQYWGEPRSWSLTLQSKW